MTGRPREPIELGLAGLIAERSATLVAPLLPRSPNPPRDPLILSWLLYVASTKLFCIFLSTFLGRRAFLGVKRVKERAGQYAFLPPQKLKQD
jgi:hypothetical protein